MYKINHDYIHLNHVVVDMAPPMMQLCPFIAPSPYTLFLTFLLACSHINTLIILDFHNLPEKCNKLCL